MAKRINNQLVDEETGEILATEVTVAPIFWKTPYNHSTEKESHRTGTTFRDESLTQQQFKDDADINVILDRFAKINEAPPVILPEHFVDLTQRSTYYDMESRVAEAKESFYMLPPKLRAKYQNDAATWAEEVVAVLSTGDLEGLKELGIQPPPTQTSTPPSGESTVTPPGGSPAPGPQSGASEAPKTAPSGAKT